MDRFYTVTVMIFILGILLLVGCNRSEENAENIEGVQDNEMKDRQEREIGEQQEATVDLIKEKIDNMNLEEKIGQMFIVGLDGYDIKENTISMIEEHKVGGFILFRHNINNSSQLLGLVNSLKEYNIRNENIPLFLSLDEEGGRVTRIPKEIENLPSNKAIGEVNDPTFSIEIGRLLGQKVKAFGFNLNYAPVLDINSNPKNPVIGDRSFGSSMEIVADLGIATMKGLQAEEVIPVIKHFPGHGDTSVDSHIGLPLIEKSLEELKRFELKPFSEAIEVGADAVMIAHILFPKIDPDSPSSMSKTIVTDILRNQMNFQGVIITDDMTMGAITEHYSIGEATVRSVEAGTDIILVCHYHDKQLEAINALKEAIEEGIISEERIDESVYRILSLKEKYNLKDESIEGLDIDPINLKIREALNKFAN